MICIVHQLYKVPSWHFYSCTYDAGPGSALLHCSLTNGYWDMLVSYDAVNREQISAVQRG